MRQRRGEAPSDAYILSNRSQFKQRKIRSGQQLESLEDRVLLTRVFDNGSFDFKVSVRFNATEAELTQIETGFQNASQVLADATDGQHKFGTVTIVNDSGASNAAAFWVHPGTGRANAYLAKFEERGFHSNLYFDSNFQGNNGVDGDAYTIAHEFAHLAYGIADSYSGPGGNAENAPGPDTPALNYSLMDNFFTRGGRANGGSTYTLNEFSVPSNHDPDGDTFQTSINGESDWETLVKSGYAAVMPANLPVDAPPAPHTVTFERGADGFGFMLLVDRSGSMSDENRIEFARAGATTFTRFVEVGDQLGVASFADSGRVDSGLVEVQGDAQKDAAIAAVNGLTPDGSTNIGGGLQSALSEFTTLQEHPCEQFIVLLSDGDHNTGTDPTSVIPALKAAGVTVLSVGVGTGISPGGQSTLQNIANETGGRYFQISSSFSQIGLYLRLLYETQGDGLLARAPEQIASGETITKDVQVETGSAKARFAMAFADDPAELDFKLVSPSGVEITSSSAAGDADVTYTETSNIKVFEIENPEPGVWSYSAEAGTVTDGNIEFLVFSENAGTQLLASIETPDVVFPDPTIVNAVVQYQGRDVLGATVTGTVLRPDGTEGTITLFDDGAVESGDQIAGDGVYSAKFDAYSAGGDGTYTFDLMATTTGAVVAPGEELLFPHDPPVSLAIPEFVRLGTTSAVVTGVPELSAPTELDLVATSDTGRFDDDDFTGDKTPTITMMADAGVTVEVFVNGGVATQATETDPGLFEVTLPESVTGVGVNEITATATDSAGTMTSPSAPLTIIIGETVVHHLDRSDPALEFTQTDGVEVRVSVNRRAEAAIELLTYDVLTELIEADVTQVAANGGFSIEGDGGNAFVPEVTISDSSLGHFYLDNVELGDVAAQKRVRRFALTGENSFLFGDFTVRRRLANAYFEQMIGGSELTVGHSIGTLMIDNDSVVDIKARRIARFYADSDLTGEIKATNRIGHMELDGDNLLDVSAPVIRRIDSYGVLDGLFEGDRIFKILARDDVDADFDVRRYKVRRRRR